MSVGFYPKNSLTMDQANKVQELCLSGDDSNLFRISGGNLYVMVREPIAKVLVASVKVDSTNLVTQIEKADIDIVDSEALTSGGDESAIELVGISSLASDDCLVVKYIVQD